MEGRGESDGERGARRRERVAWRGGEGSTEIRVKLKTGGVR